MEFMYIGDAVVRKDAILTLRIVGGQNYKFIEIGLSSGQYIRTELKTEEKANKQLDVILDILEAGE